MSSSFSMSSAVRGYHVYKDIWAATVGEVLTCSRELHNLRDPFAVAVKKGSIIVGHVPRTISAACSMFLRRNGTISCQVTGNRRYSSDLPQGGLEIPCILTFSGDAMHVEKVKGLLEDLKLLKAKADPKTDDVDDDGSDVGESKSDSITEVHSTDEEESMPKRRKVGEDTNNSVWVSIRGIILTETDKHTISNGSELTDMHINFFQQLLHQQFPTLEGLRSSLSPVIKIGTWIDKYMQIFHCYGNHWVCASTIGCQDGTIQIYDSMYSVVCKDVQTILSQVFSQSKVQCKVTCIQKQNGTKDLRVVCHGS